MAPLTENDASGPGVICTNTKADCCSPGELITIVFGDRTIVGEFVSKSTFSGSVAIELIRIGGFAMIALASSVLGSGKTQFNVHSINRSEAPTYPKYLSRGIRQLLAISAPAGVRLSPSNFVVVGWQLRKLSTCN
jgi:hypothetical protein